MHFQGNEGGDWSHHLKGWNSGDESRNCAHCEYILVENTCFESPLLRIEDGWSCLLSNRFEWKTAQGEGYKVWMF